MKVWEALIGVTLLGIDTAPFIYFVEQHPTYLNLMREVLKLVDGGTILACSSVITLTELLTMPLRSGNFNLANEYRRLLYYSRNFRLIPVSVTIAERAALIRAQHNFRTPDAIQIATALHCGCDAFLTNDVKLKRVTELRVLVLDELL